MFDHITHREIIQAACFAFGFYWYFGLVTFAAPLYWSADRRADTIGYKIPVRDVIAILLIVPLFWPLFFADIIHKVYRSRKR